MLLSSVAFRELAVIISSNEPLGLVSLESR